MKSREANSGHHPRLTFRNKSLEAVKAVRVKQNSGSSDLTVNKVRYA